MTDEHKKNTGDEEYQFPSDEYSVSEEGATDATYAEQQGDETEHVAESDTTSLASRFEFLKNKRIVVTVVIVIVAFFGFKLLAPSSNKAQQPVRKAAVKVQQTAVPSAQVEGQLGALKQQSLSNQQVIRNLRGEVQSLQHSLGTASNANAQLTQSVQQLAAQVQHLNTQIQADTPKKHASKKKALPAPPKITYNLVAILPGRAWIQNNYGKSTTVRVGDVLKQYGEVESINTSRGLVLTSSGKTIRYGADDN